MTPTESCTPLFKMTCLKFATLAAPTIAALPMPLFAAPTIQYDAICPFSERRIGRIDSLMQDHHHSELDRKTTEPHDSLVRQAVILAAGVGVRLKERGVMMPKGCLCLGENPIIEESILRLLAVGIKQIVIVTGHLAEQFEPLLLCLRAQFGNGQRLAETRPFAHAERS